MYPSVTHESTMCKFIMSTANGSRQCPQKVISGSNYCKRHDAVARQFTTFEIVEREIDFDVLTNEVKQYANSVIHKEQRNLSVVLSYGKLIGHIVSTYNQEFYQNDYVRIKQSVANTLKKQLEVLSEENEKLKHAAKLDNLVILSAVDSVEKHKLLRQTVDTLNATIAQCKSIISSQQCELKQELDRNKSISKQLTDAERRLKKVNNSQRIVSQLRSDYATLECQHTQLKEQLSKQEDINAELREINDERSDYINALLAEQSVNAPITEFLRIQACIEPSLPNGVTFLTMQRTNNFKPLKQWMADHSSELCVIIQAGQFAYLLEDNSPAKSYHLIRKMRNQLVHIN